MAKYTIQQCLEISTLSPQVKQYLEALQNSRLPNVKERTFTADTKAKLVALLESEREKYLAAKAKRMQKQTAKTQCLDIVKYLLTLVTADELLEKLQALQNSIEAEKKFTKINKALEATGMTKEQLIEYLTK